MVRIAPFRHQFTMPHHQPVRPAARHHRAQNFGMLSFVADMRGADTLPVRQVHRARPFAFVVDAERDRRLQPVRVEPCCRDGQALPLVP